MAERLKGIGTHITRYGLVIVLLWIGGMKFTAYEVRVHGSRVTFVQKRTGCGGM